MESNMTPYNICENKWLNKAKEKAKKHLDDNKTLYVGYFYVMLLGLFVLALLTAIDSFY
jgi:hypothetical protein